jgi:hypothetical protein
LVLVAKPSKEIYVHLQGQVKSGSVLPLSGV